MLRALFAASIALALSGCASIPEQKAPAKKAPIVRQTSKAIAKPVVVASEAKSPTFKQRWMPKFKIKWLYPR
jgi:hypothetical protein